MTNAGSSYNRTVTQVIFEATQRYSIVVALDDPHGKPATKLTYGQLERQIRAFGAGMAAMGVDAGERVALFSDNRPRWMIADLGLLGIGAVDVPRGSDTANAEFEFILQHSGATAAVLQDNKLYSRLKDSAALTSLKLVVLMDDSAPPATEANAAGKLVNFQDVTNAGEAALALFETRNAAITGTTLATIVYTSGTTGSPKGVMLSHANLAYQPDKVNLGTRPKPGEIQLSILPTWHAYERATEYYGMKYGSTITYSDKRYIKQDLEKLKPHLMPCVPRIWESVYDTVQDKLRKAPPARQKLFAFFSGAGRSYIQARRIATGLDVRKVPASSGERMAARAKMLALAPVFLAGDQLIFSKIRGVTGGRMHAAVSGGGSLAPYLDDFFEMIGVPILNGYGLTETSPVLANRRTDHNIRGSVGLPVEGTELQIRDETGKPVSQGTAGIIWARGPQVMQAYYRNEEATAKVLTSDGWFNTGDLGFISTTGDLVISGRAKDTIVLVSGENVEPEPIEDVARKSTLISQIVVVGQDQKYVGALVVPNAAALASSIGMPEDTELLTLCADPKAAKAVREAIAKVMAADGTFKASDQVSKVALLSEPFSEQNGMLTQTMKIKRNIVAQKYADRIEALFK